MKGNITTLTRAGLYNGTYTYNYNGGNQLQSVTNLTSGTYTYDGNGNATSDGMSKSISYNLLNLPRSVASVATYTYDATGNKLHNTGSDGSWDYINGITYFNNAIKYITTEEGRATPNGGGYTYQYDLKDHLGDVRVTFDQYNNAVRVLQEDEYYAFGLRKSDYDYTNNNRHLYNGKELQVDLANQYDYGARFYDPVVARWNVIDRFAEKYTRWSPYNYGGNNPISNIDMNGDSIRTAGNANATAAYKQSMEAGMGNIATMNQDSKGNWTMSSLTEDQQMSMTGAQADMYKSLNTMIGDSKTASFNLIDQSSTLSNQILIGDNGAAPAGYTVTPGVHTIDMGDVKNMGTTGVLTSYGALMHETSEGFQIQTKGATGTDAHFNTAIPTESAVNGVSINLSRRSQPTVGGTGNTQTVSIPVTVNGVQRTVTINFVNGNIQPFGVQNNNRP